MMHSSRGELGIIECVAFKKKITLGSYFRKELSSIVEVFFPSAAYVIKDWVQLISSTMTMMHLMIA